MSKRCSAALQLFSNTMGAAAMAEVLGIEGAVLLEQGQKVSDRENARVYDTSIWRLESRLMEDSIIDNHISSLVEHHCYR